MITAVTSLGPAALTVAVLRPHSGLGWLGAAVLAGGLSTLVIVLAAAGWQRLRLTSDVVFSELLPWGFARRCYAELRLRGMRSSYELAARRNAAVRVDQLEGLARLQASRVPYTHGHCRRVANHAERIARAMDLSPASVAKLRTAALIHDVGKVFTPTAILNKAGPLTDEEFAVIQQHAVDGAELVRGGHDAELVQIVRHHHERLDGSGYPDGLAGQTIPLGARILAVADTFDAVTSHRPYRRARSQREGLELLRSERGTRLDAAAVDAFQASYSARRSVVSLAAASAAVARCVEAFRLIPLLGQAGAGTAGLLPALGAAGVVAVTPALAHNTPRGAPRARSAGALVAQAQRRVPAARGLPAPSRAPQTDARTFAGPRARVAPPVRRGTAERQAAVALRDSARRPESPPAGSPAGRGDETPRVISLRPSEAVPALPPATTPVGPPPATPAPVTPTPSTPAPPVLERPAVDVPTVGVPAVSAP